MWRRGREEKARREKAEREAEFDRRLLSNIQEHGWSGMTVSPRADDPGDEPIFKYTIGFETSLNMPNLIVFGLRKDIMHAMLWNMFHDLKAGRALTDSAQWHDILDGYTCVTRAVHESQIDAGWFNYGRWYRRTHAPEAGPYTAFQIFWPGVIDRLLPWEAGSDPAVIKAQPRLDLPREMD
jgi:hypothetical protein